MVFLLKILKKNIFLNNKKTELVSILYGDIKGGPEKEIITVMHSFGSQGELYIWDGNQRCTSLLRIAEIGVLRTDFWEWSSCRAQAVGSGEESAASIRMVGILKSFKAFKTGKNWYGRS